MTGRGPVLVIDTSTTRAVIAVGGADGALREQRAWTAGYRHGEELLARIEELLAVAGVAPAELGAIAVGTGPGAFTGLRVGIATAKGLAHALGIPILGVGSGLALLDAAHAAAPERGRLALAGPAGPRDRVIVRPGEPPRIVSRGADLGLAPDEGLVAVDLAGDADPAATALGEAAVTGLAGAVLAAAASRLAAGEADDLAALVPQYATLPRGVLAAPPELGVEVSRSTGGAR